MTGREWFIEAFDRFIGSEGQDGAELEKSRDAVAQVYVDGVESGQIERWRDDITDEARALFDRWVKPERSRRRQTMLKSARAIVDALAGETILGPDDPILQLAFPLGDGRDKRLALWTEDDWSESSVERFRNAASVTSAAADYDLAVQEIRAAFRKRDASTTRDLFGGES